MSDMLPTEKQKIINGLTEMKGLLDVAIQMVKDGKSKDEIGSFIETGMDKINGD